MALGHSPKIVTDGLVFAYDMANIQKSWKGKPTVNYIGNGEFNGGTGIENESGSYGNNVITQFANPGSTPYVMRQGPGGGEYEIHPKSDVSMSLLPNTTYCMSIWVTYTPDWDGNSMTLHSRWYDGSGNPYTTATDGVVYDTKVIGGQTWQRRYTTFTTPATTSGTYNWYLGYPTNNTIGYRYITSVMLEEGSFSTPFVNGTRTNTQSLVDLTNNNTITANSLTYNADGTFGFNGSSDYISSPAGFSNFTSGITLSAWVYFSSSTGGWVRIFDFGNGSPSDNFLFCRYSTTSNLFWGIYPGTGSVNMTGGTITFNGWGMYTATADGTNMKIYVNGVLAATYATAQLPTVVTRNNNYIGKSNWADPYLNGKVSNAQIYNRALTAAEVAQNFNALRGRYGV